MCKCGQGEREWKREEGIIVKGINTGWSQYIHANMRVSDGKGWFRSHVHYLLPILQFQPALQLLMFCGRVMLDSSS